MSESRRYYKVTGKSALTLFAGMKAQRKVINAMSRWAKKLGATGVYRRGVSVNFTPFAVEFEEPPDKALWARASRDYPHCYRPRRTPKNKELVRKFESFTSHELGEAMIQVGLEYQTWHGLSLTSPGLNVVGRAVYVVTMQDDIRQNKDIRRISDIEYERAMKRRQNQHRDRRGDE